MYQQVRLACDEFDVLGLAFPGVPGVQHFGHTGTARGGSPTRSRTTSRCSASGSRDDGLSALGPDGWAPVARHTETIRVRGGDDVDVDVVETRARSVVARRAQRPVPRPRRAPTSGSRACCPLLRSRSAADVAAALRGWVDPVNRVLTADADGTVLASTRARRDPRRRRTGGCRTTPGPPPPARRRGTGWPNPRRCTDVAVDANERPATGRAATSAAPTWRRTGPDGSGRCSTRAARSGPRTWQRSTATPCSAAPTSCSAGCAGPTTLSPAAAALRDRLLAWDRHMDADSTDAGAFAAWRTEVAVLLTAHPALAPLHAPHGRGVLLDPWLGVGPRVADALPRLLGAAAIGIDGAAVAREALERVASAGAPAATCGPDLGRPPPARSPSRPCSAPPDRPWTPVPLSGDTDCVRCTASVPGVSDRVVARVGGAVGVGPRRPPPQPVGRAVRGVRATRRARTRPTSWARGRPPRPSRSSPTGTCSRGDAASVSAGRRRARCRRGRAHGRGARPDHDVRPRPGRGPGHVHAWVTAPARSSGAWGSSPARSCATRTPSSTACRRTTPTSCAATTSPWRCSRSTTPRTTRWASATTCSPGDVGLHLLVGARVRPGSSTAALFGAVARVPARPAGRPPRRRRARRPQRPCPRPHDPHRVRRRPCRSSCRTSTRSSRPSSPWRTHEQHHRDPRPQRSSCTRTSRGPSASPRTLVRVTLTGDDLRRFEYRGFDQWFRLAVPVDDHARFDNLPDQVRHPLATCATFVLPKSDAAGPSATTPSLRVPPATCASSTSTSSCHGTAGRRRAVGRSRSRSAPRSRSSTRAAAGPRVLAGAGRCYGRSTSRCCLRILGILRDMPRDAVGHAIVELIDAADAQDVDAPAGRPCIWASRAERRRTALELPFRRSGWLPRAQPTCSPSASRRSPRAPACTLVERARRPQGQRHVLRLHPEGRQGVVRSGSCHREQRHHFVAPRATAFTPTPTPPPAPWLALTPRRA